MSDRTVAARSRLYVVVCLVLAAVTATVGSVDLADYRVRGSLLIALAVVFLVQAVYWIRKAREIATSPAKPTSGEVVPSNEDATLGSRRGSAWWIVAALIYVGVVSGLTAQLSSPANYLVFAGALFLGLAVQRLVRDFWT